MKSITDADVAALAVKQDEEFKALASKSGLAKYVVDAAANVNGATAKSFMAPLWTAADAAMGNVELTAVVETDLNNRPTNIISQQTSVCTGMIGGCARSPVPSVQRRPLNHLPTRTAHRTGSTKTYILNAGPNAVMDTSRVLGGSKFQELRDCVAHIPANADGTNPSVLGDASSACAPPPRPDQPDAATRRPPPRPRAAPACAQSCSRCSR